MKNLFKGAKPGRYLSLAAAAVGLVGSIVYLILYSATAAEEYDRVFSWLTLGLAAGGSLIALLGEVFDLHFAPLLAGAAFSVALANHLTETAYPLADILTRVPFFGGNAPMAIAFSVVFAVAALLNLVASFMDHVQTKV